MKPIEEQELRTRARAMSVQEKEIVLQEFPTTMLHEELYKRDQIHEMTLMRIQNVLNGGE